MDFAEICGMRSEIGGRRIIGVFLKRFFPALKSMVLRNIEKTKNIYQAEQNLQDGCLCLFVLFLQYSQWCKQLVLFFPVFSSMFFQITATPLVAFSNSLFGHFTGKPVPRAFVGGR